MSKPKKFIVSSDFATLKNDSATTTVTVNIPATSIAGGGTIETYSNTVTIGEVGSPIEYDINYSATTRRWKTTRFEFVENEGTGTQYQGAIFIYKNGPSSVVVSVNVFNGNAGAVIKTARTVTVRIRTFLSPFN